MLPDMDKDADMLLIERPLMLAFRIALPLEVGAGVDEMMKLLETKEETA